MWSPRSRSSWRTRRSHRGAAGSGRATAIHTASAAAKAVTRANVPDPPSHCSASPIQATAIYWYFVVVLGVVIYLVLYLSGA